MIKPPEDCPQCHGRGWVHRPSSNDFVKCGCVIRQEGIEYLTQVYKDAKYIKNLGVSDKNMVFEDYYASKFKSIAKTFLINSAMNCSHKTLSGYQIFQIYLDKVDGVKLTDPNLIS